MNSENKDRSRWNLKKLLLWNLPILLLVAFFIGDDFKTPWDEIIFFTLNGSLQEGRDFWNGYWAITNSRYFDSFSGIFIASLCFIYLLKNRDNSFQERFSRVLLLVISVAAIMISISRGFNLYYHQSPSQVLSPFVNINDLVNWIEVKTGTRKSFPSDHAAISFVSVILMWRLFGTRYGIVIAIFALINATPRMVGGGHWFGDVAIGGLLLAMFISVWAIYSPLLNWLSILMEKIMSLGPVSKVTANWK